jgi:uncharacterized membrane protein YbaN (DUF454 family)
MSNTPTILPNNRTKLAAVYGVSYKVFIAWLKEDKELMKHLKKYEGKRSLPPTIINKIVESLGAPD